MTFDKAYSVSVEDNQAITFAASSGQARAWGACEFGEDFTIVEVKRVPAYDVYAEAGHVPSLILIRDGWWFECVHCGCTVSRESRGEDQSHHEPCADSAGLIFCTPACRQGHADAMEQDQRWGASALKQALTRFPGGKVIYNGVQLVGERPGRIVSLILPGGLSIDWRELEPELVTLSEAAVPKWHAYGAWVRQNATSVS